MQHSQYMWRKAWACPSAMERHALTVLSGSEGQSYLCFMLRMMRCDFTQN